MEHTIGEPMKKWQPLRITDRNRAGDVYIGNDDETHMVIVVDTPFCKAVKVRAAYIVQACNEYKDLKQQRDDLLNLCRDIKKVFWMIGSGVHVAGTLPGAIDAIENRL